MKNLYAAFLCIVGMFSALTQSQAKNFGGPIAGNTIGSNQTICTNTTPVALTGSLPTGGSGSYFYQWQVSTTSAIAGFASIAGGTAQGYAPGVLTTNHWYRRIVISGILFDTTAAVTITVTPIITHAANTIAAAQTICTATTPAPLTGSSPAGGNGTYTYQWLSSPDNATWTPISGATSIGYSPPALTATTYYERTVLSGGCSDISPSIKITITPVIANDIVSTNQSICSGQAPLGLTGTTPTGGSGAYTYQWLSSTTSATTGFGIASGTSTTINYAPAALTQTTWFTRVTSSGGCTDTATAVTITVVSSAPGNPTVFGNGVWNAYVYSDNAFTTYAGYYTEPLFSFLTSNRYTVNQSPSSASGYQGCLVQPTNFSVSFKQTNFTPGYYQADLTGVDDNFTMFVNGVQVYTHACCINPPTVVSNVWTGYLGATDQVEIRWSQNAGPSIAGMNFTAVTPSPLNPGAIAGSQSVCVGQQPANAFTNTTTPTSGCSIINGYQWQSSIDSVTWTNIAGATALTYTVPGTLSQTTWYRRGTTDACNNFAATLPVKVTVNVTPPGNPAIFGNGVWNDYVYSDNTFTTYAGYYTEPLLSFLTSNRYTVNQSPSSASGYQGCLVPPTFFSVSMKQTNFTPATYQIDLTGVDDNVSVYINGALVASHGCCINPPTVVSNLWTGPLGATDQVEIRWSQNAGPSIAGFNFTAVTPTPLVAATITPSQTICAGNVPPTPFTQSVAPSGGCTIKGYQWQSSTDNGTTWTPISGATGVSYTPTASIYTQTLFDQITYDVCGNSATSVPDTIYMNNTPPGNPAVFGNGVWNDYCFQDVNYSVYAGYYTEPLLTFNTANRYPTTSPPSTASGYQGCQLINTYYSVSMKRTGFTPGIYQIDVTADDDYNLIYINGVLVSSLTYPTIQNNVWTGNLGATDQVEIRWRNNAGPGQAGDRFTLVTPTPLNAGSIAANNPNLCPGDLPVVNNTAAASGGCYPTYSWQSSTNGGVTWTTISGATGLTYTASIAPAGNIEYERIAIDACNDTAITAPVTFIQGGGAVGNPATYGNGVWNAYAYDANGASFGSALYLGYYVEPLLSFNSANRWNTNTGAPSDASGYQGCQVDHDNHWVSYKQTNFPPGTYQIDIPDHDDDVYLYVDGVLVFSQTGCCVANTNVWTGTLGATDQVEFRWRNFYGPSIGELTLTLVTPPVNLLPGVVASSQTICYNSTPAAFTSTTLATSSCFVNYQWQSAAILAGPWTNISGATTSTYSVSAPLTANTYYRRSVTDACGNIAYSDTLTVTLYSNTLTPGTIAASQTICSGTVPATLTSTGLPAGGDGNFVYQWQSSPDNIVWTNIAGATATTYSPAALSSTINYRRNVTDCGGTLTASSAAVTITVNQPPVITLQPANATACSGGNTSISVTVTGSGLTYQWQINPGSGWVNAANGPIYTGAKTATLNITGVTAAMSGYQYRLVITGTCTPVVTSNSATLTVGTNPTISSQPANITVCTGSNATFFVTASGSGLTYQWQQKIGAAAWTNLMDTGMVSGSLTSTLVLTGVSAAMNGYSYQCIVNTSCGGTVTSSVAKLTVVAAITNTIAASQAICSGTAAANLTGNGGATSYQWQSSTISSSSGFVPASGVNNGQNYNPNPVSTSTWYQRLYTNTGCSSLSNVDSIAFVPTAIAISSQPANQATCPGANASYSVTASGPGTLTYQWYENKGSGFNPLVDGGIYSGSATSTLNLTGVTGSMNGYTYYVKIFASGCSTSSLNSNQANLTTNNSPVVTSATGNTTTCVGSNVNLTVNATGIGLSYQWQQNTGSGWNNLSNNAIFGNVNGTPLTITGATIAMNGSQYQCIVTGSCSPSATSTPMTLTVNPAIANNSIANSQTLCAGTPAPFTVSSPTGGSGSYTYQWQQNTGSGFANIAGATSTNYSPGSLTQTTQYLRQVSDGVCAANNSIAITITINPPTSTTNPANVAVCANTNAVFSVTGTGTSLSYQWQVNPASGTFSNISNGVQYSGATTANLTVNAAPAGFNNYQYRCIVSGACSPTSVTSTAAILTINSVANITSQPSNVSSCSGSTATFTVSATGTGITYQWLEKVGAGAFTPITNGGIYGGATTATLTLTGITTAMNTNQYECMLTIGGCPVTSSVASLTVNAQPTLVITNPAAVCAPATVDITAAAVTAGSNLQGGTLSYWKDAATTVPLTNPTTVSVSGTYYIRVATSSACYAVSPVIVNVNATIGNNTISAAQSICTGSSAATLTGGVPTGGNGTYTYQWQSSPDNATWLAISGAASPSYSPGVVASTTYYQRIVTSSPCASTSASIAITVLAYPTATISYSGSPYCAIGTATPTQTGQAGGTYTAPTGVSITAGTGVINLAASTPGTYTITYSFTNGTCGGTTTASVTINALPTATIAYSGSPYCATGTATPTQTGTAGGTYTAPAGVSITAGTGVINLATSTPGTYTITYSFSNGTCSGTTTASVTINALPTATIAYSGSPYCATGTATPTQTGTAGGTYTAPAGVSITAATGVINLATSTPGTYTITYSFTAGGCNNTTTASVTINALPTATIAYGGSPYCATGTATPTQTGTAGGTYTAPAGVSITAATGVINLVTSTPGTYTITYSFTGGGCSNTTATSITINSLPTATIAYGGSPYCATGTATPTQTGQAGGTYTAPAGVSITAATGVINLASSTPGTYTVTYSFSNGTCANTTTASITVNALPTAAISYTGSPYCATGTATVTQTGQAGGTYTAPAGVSITAATGAINLVTSTPGTYTITYSFTGGGCSNTTTASVTINALPTATIAYIGTPYCATGTATPTQTGQAGGTYTAPAGVSITAATGVINLVTSTPGTYTITYSFSSGGCSNTATTSITIKALPTATIAYSGSPYCATGTATPTQTGTAGGTYTAPAGVSITAGTGVINIATSTPGTYTITYSFTNGGCSNTTTASITINALPTATIAYSGSPYCTTGTATPTQTGQAGGTYTAPAGVSITAATGMINLVTSTPGTYTITYSFTGGGCSNTTTASITINALPTATIVYSGSPYCATGTATPTQTGTAGGTYTAPAGVSITAATGVINLATSTPGTYTVTYNFSNGTCANTTTASITIKALPTATIAYSGSPYCATGTATPTQTGTAGGTYTAPAGVSITAATGVINLATSTPGTYTITYSFTGGGCSNTTTASITINALPTATIAYSGSPYCATGTATPTQTGTAGGTYTAPAGVSITAATGVINLATSTPGTYTITYSFTSGGCSNTTTASITINALPTATIAYSGSPYCATGTATPTQTGQAGGTYTAPAGVSITAATGVINLATSTPGTYTVTYSFTSGGCSNTTTASITINALPTATIAYSGSPYCATGTATPTQTGTTGGTYTAPAGVSITAATGVINLATSTPGTYTITYSFTSGGCSNTTIASITIKALPTATIAYSGSPYCATGTATPTQTGTAGGTYTAPAGVSITAASGVINLATSTPGTYTITYSFTGGGCSNTTTASITINALPTATISYAGSPYCATGTATPTQTGQAGGTYTAPAGVSITAATGIINLATSTPGTYTITYTFTGGGCSNATTASITINALPTATISYAGSPYCATGTATPTQTGQAGGTYTAPAGVSITAATGIINLATSTPGTYTVTYSFSNGTCSGTTTASVTINALPTATISYAGSPYCAIGTATATQTGTAGGAYTAPAGVSITAATGAINLATSTPGTYTITYSFTSGGCSNTATASITINALPTATIAYSGSPYCATGTATATQTGTAGGTYTAPAGVSITAATGAINLATSTPGTYTITYSFTSGGCSNTATASITINALPTATIAYSGSPYCATGTAAPTQTGTAGGTYTAPAGVSITAATGVINLATSTPGTYTITYSFTGGGCSNTTTASITINALPTATIAYSGSPYCATGTAAPTQTGTAGGTYTAPAGVSITAATGVINLATSTPGTYTITYSFTSGGCSNTATASITINALPTATISYAGSPYCATSTATPTQTGTAGGTYSAPAGVSITAATGVINLASSTPGTYTITYSFNSGSCSNTTTTSITINALPTATIAYSGSPYCATGTATPTQTGTAGGTYTAPAGVSITAATGVINLATSTPGTYTITYSFTGGGCSNTTTASITITALPTATISYAASPYCATGTATATQTGTAGGTYSAPAGVSITAATGVINLASSTPGTYTITYSFNSGSCSNTTTTSITINALPTATIAYSGSPYCATGTATPTQTGTAGGTYTAPAGVSITAATGVINLTTSTAGTYTITYSFSNGTCANTTTASITISALPTATITYAGSPYCATGTATVTQTGQAGGTYTAPAGVSINAGTGAINLATSTPGIYTITYSFTGGTCGNTATASINIITAPQVTITNPPAVCSPSTVDLTAPSVTSGSTPGLTYTYYTNAGATIVLTNPNAVSVTGTYYIKGSAGSGCSDIKPVAVTVNAQPTVVITNPAAVCAPGTVDITAASVTAGSTAGLAYTYFTDAGATTVLSNPNAVSVGGTYYIKGTNGSGCSAVQPVTVTINALPTAAIAYGGSPYCAIGTATPMQTGQAGGTYTAPPGVSIAAATGVINLVTSTPGTYTITYSFTNGTCANTTTASITINALPTATISYGGSPYCATATATPTQTGTVGGTYAAPAGVSITAATGVINLATSTPGTYTITYSFISGGCSNTTTASITINALPTATIAYIGSPYCATGTASPTQTGQAGGIYTAPAGVSITAATGVINLATSTPGTYTITYSFSNGTCSNTAIASITINALPTATVSYAGNPYCATGTATPTQTGQAGGTYTAPAGVSIAAATGVINLAASTPGTYTITYSFNSGGCSNTTTTSITINALPVATISYAGSPYCATGSATVTQTGQAGGTYTAPAGVSIIAASGVINLATSTPGTYTITYSFTNGTCGNTTTTSVTINALPTATIAYSGTPYCATGTATPTQTGQAGGTYTAPAGVSITAATGVINLATSTPGTYTITYTFTNGTCGNTTTAAVTINALPTATIAYSGSPYCATGTATPTQTGQGGGTYTAPAGVSIIAGTGVINLATSTPGTYTVTYSFGNGTCNNTTTASITINALPTATISYTGSPYCAIGTATPTQTGTTGGTYTAPAGISITATTGLINLATSTPGTYTITYSFTNGTCNNTATASVTIVLSPNVVITNPPAVCSPSTVDLTAASVTSGSTAGLTYTYFKDAAATIVLTNPNAVAVSGTYYIKGSTASGCDDIQSVVVTINPLPVATISYSGSPYCATGTATPTQTGTAGGTYTAPAGVSITAGTGVINLAASTPGTYTVTYSFTNGTCPNTAIASITINALPAATIVYSGSPYCATGIATPTQTGQAGGTYTAPAGVSIIAATGAINLAASTPGTYTITYIFSNGTCGNTATTSVTINALPTAVVSYAGSPYCATGTATPTQTGQAGGIYTAPAGVSITAATGAINLAASTPGTYTITYSFSNGTCGNITTASITINALPTAIISYTGSPYCAVGIATVTQTGQAGGAYTSAPGLNIDATTGTVNLATSTPGTYTVTYSFGNGTCNNTATTSIIVKTLPTATIAYSGSPYCATGTATVTQTGQAGGSYNAPAGVVINAASGDINLNTSTPGTYTIVYTFSNGSCSNTTTTSVTINALPTATISYAGSPYCATGTATPTQTGQVGGTYTAPAGVSITAATGAINLSTSTPGTYTITYSFTGGGCGNTTTASITINALPTATIAYSSSPYCATATAVPTQTGQAGGTYTAPAGVSITAATGIINLATSTPGTYTITYSFSNGTCNNTTTTSITINSLPTATIAYTSSPYCATGTATPTQTGQGGGTYSAPAGVSIAAATGLINLSASTAGTYTITYSFTNGTCSSTTTATITINALPTATISYAGSPYCGTGTATVTQTGQAGGTYTAPAGVSITAATGDINLATSIAGTYTVTYTFSNGTCANTSTTSITINGLPNATIAYAASPYCGTGTATVTQTGQAGGTYTAPAGVSITAATGDINLATSTPGTYTVTYSYGNGTCSNSTTSSITINALPTATIAFSGSPYCATGTATPTQTGQAGGTYTAPAGVSITAATGVINLATSTPGTYTVTYSFSNGTCSNTTTTNITINALPIATIAYSASPYCATGTASPTQTGQAGGTYTAPAGVSITAATGIIDLATSIPGTYTITYTFSNGTCGNIATANITINALPTATISYAGSPYCSTGTATPTQTGQAGGTYTAPAGVSITAATGAVNLASSTPGTYTITYSFTNGSCSNTTTTSVTINALPTAAISYAGSPYCGTGIATVTQTGQAGGTYTAPAGVSITAATGDINLTTSTPGTYTVTYTFSNGTCGNTTTTSITINGLPNATIAYAGSPYCATGTATVTQTGQAGGTYSAPAAVSINAETGDINLATSTPGTYTITYSYGNGICSNSTTTLITISALPIATIAYGGSPYCGTGIATVTQTGQAGGTYTAPAGVSITAATGVINLATSTPGTYTVTYSFSNGTCSNTTTTNITVNALPIATIAYAASPYCAIGTATPTQTGQAGGTYTAPAGVSIIAATGAINLASSTPGTYTITYTFSNGTCSNTATTSITINALPTAIISYPGSPYCAVGIATATQTGQIGGTYTSTAGLTIDATTGTVNLASSTAGTYTVTYSFSNGTCSNTTTGTITVNALPTAAITYSGSPYCESGTATVTQTGQAGGTYNAPAAVVINGTTGDINLNTSTPGTYTIVYTFSNGSCGNTTTTSITINALPTATISYPGSPYCATGTATATQSGQAGGAYSSTTGLVIDATTGTIDLVASTPGTYTVTYSFGNGVCSNTTTTSVTINGLPTVVTNNPAAVCAPGTVDLTAAPVTTGSTSGLTFTYFTDAAGTIVLVNANAVAASGTYYIEGTAPTGCTAIQPVTVTINPQPSVVITNPAQVCSPSTVDITTAAVTAGSTPGLTYSYYTDAAGTLLLANANAVAISGTYYIKGTAPTGCMDIEPVVVTINALPTATISYTGSPYCATGTATATQTGQASGTYTSSAGLNIDPVTGNINLASSTAGIYTVTYTFSNATCSNTTTGSITINALPTATISYTGSPYCETGTATVTQSGQGGGFYTAPAGVVINGTSGDVNLNTSTPGIYTITYTFSDGTCSNTTTASITINALPTASIAYTGSPYCATGTATVSQSGQTGGAYAALPAGLSIDATTGAINLASSTPNTYTVTYSFGNGTCTNTTTTTVTVNALPTATIAYTGTPYCTFATAIVTLTGTGGGVFSSTAGLSLNAATGDINLATSTEGHYVITYNFSSGGCSNTTSTSLDIKNPTVMVTNPAGECFPATVDLTNPAITAGSQSGLSYNYYQDNAGTIPVTNPTSVPAGDYYIRGVDMSTGCSSDIQEIVVTVFAKPTITASSSDTDICKGTTVTLTASSPGNTITWPGLGSGSPISATPLDSTVYLAVATTASGCMDTAYVNVDVRPFTVTLTANPDPVLAGTNTTLTTSGNFTYNVLSWSPAVFFTDQTATSQNIVVKDTSKSFTVIAQSTDGCLDTATLYVVVDPNLKDFFIPNSFSPNNDGVNDIFKVYGSSVRDVTMRVYNQWGELVYESQNATGGWDGTWKGRPQAVGVYVYIAEVTFYNNVTIKRKGTLNLIR